MPTYVFLDKKVGECFEVFMKMSEREGYLKDNPDLEQVITAPNIVSGVFNQKKIPDGFKSVIAKVADAHPSSPLADKYRRKSIKEARTARVVEKHVKKISKQMSGH